MIAVIIVAIIATCVLYAQKKHYEFVNSKLVKTTMENLEIYLVKSTNAMEERLEQKLKEFDEYKKKVDALTLRAGFKL